MSAKVNDPYKKLGVKYRRLSGASLGNGGGDIDPLEKNVNYLKWVHHENLVFLIPSSFNRS